MDYVRTRREMRRAVRRPAALLVAISAIAWPACSSEPESAEAQIRALLVEMEVAAEAKAVDPLHVFISERYTDDLGNDRRAIVRLVVSHFLRNQSIHLLTRVASIELPEPERASVTVYVAMAGHPIPDADALTRLRANLYRFDLALEDTGKVWQVTRAAWRPAETRDFL